MSLATILVKVGDVLLSKAGKTILKGAGIGVASMTLSLTVLNAYIAHIQSSYGALGALAGLAGLAGANVALSIIFSALVIKMTMKAKMLTFKKLTK